MVVSLPTTVTVGIKFKDKYINLASANWFLCVIWWELCISSRLILEKIIQRYWENIKNLACRFSSVLESTNLGLTFIQKFWDPLYLILDHYSFSLKEAFQKVSTTKSYETAVSAWYSLNILYFLVHHLSHILIWLDWTLKHK